MTIKINNPTLFNVADEVDVDEIGEALYRAAGLIVRRLRQLRSPQGLTWPERTVLARLDRGGPSTAAALEQAEQIYIAPIGVTLGSLETRKLVHGQPDAYAGGEPVMSLTPSGLGLLRYDRAARTALISKALADHLGVTELRALSRAVPVIEVLGTEL